jgi:tRNA(Ile)-lysidine synthase
VRAELDRLAPAGAVGVAVSGGGDSTALLLIAWDWARDQGRPLAAATVDHGLRPDSAAEAAGVAALCARLGIPHETLKAEGLGAAAGNLPAAAREARFALLGQWAARRGLAAVLLGHTMDDQAETVLMRLARGSGAEGLAAMQAAVRRHGLCWLRPLLGVRREALRALLRARNEAWIEDPTNEDPGYDRVRARRALAALAPLGVSVEGLARTAARLARQRRVLERAMRELAARARTFGPFGEAGLDLAAMAADEEDTALRLLADTLMRVAGAAYRPRFAALEAAWQGMRQGARRRATLAGCLILPARGGADAALVCREPAACEPPRPLGGGACLWDRRWRISTTGPWPPGTQVGALGAAGLAALAAAARAGAWAPPKPWAAAARAVRLTTPALWDGGAATALLAAPLAGYLDPACAAQGCGVSARLADAGELPPAAPPD